MHANFPFMFDCWADPVTHLHLLKSSMVACSVTRLGDLLHFRQLFEAYGNNYFAKLGHIFRQFFKGVKIFHFSSVIIMGRFL